MLKYRARFTYQIEPWMSNRLGLANPVELMLFALIYTCTIRKTGVLMTSYKVLQTELGCITENTLAKYLKILEKKKLISREIVLGSGIYKYCAINWDKAAVGSVEANEKEFCDKCVNCIERKPQICYCQNFLEEENNFCKNFVRIVSATTASSFEGGTANVVGDSISSFEGAASNIAGDIHSKNKGGAANIDTPPVNFASKIKYIKDKNIKDYKKSQFFRPPRL